MKNAARILAALLVALASPAIGQSTVLQGGAWTNGHVPMYANSGSSQPVIMDSGPAGGGGVGVGLSELGITARSTGSPPFAGTGTGPNGEILCAYDGPTTGPNHYLCLSPNAEGGGLLSYGAQGGASELPLQFMVNGDVLTLATTGAYDAGAVLCFDTGSDQIVACPNTTGTGDIVYSNNPDMGDVTADTLAVGALSTANATITGGTITGVDISSLASDLPIADGGTGASSAPAARTNLGLGTIATQNASGVAITGGTITGLPTPVASTDAANKAYVDSVGQGLFPLAASRLITVGALPTNTYSNGASGVGATLTATTNGALSVDGVAVSSSNIIVVNNEAAPANNGIYTVTNAGSGGAPYVLTRVTYFDTSAEMLKNSYTAITAGNTQVGTSWILAANVTTVGTTAVNFNLFSSSALNSLPNGQIFIGNASGIATANTVSGDGTLSNTGVLTVTRTNNVLFAASATTNTTNAANITSGTLPAARLPNPSASTLGGVQSYAAVANQFLTSISTSGVPVSAQPGFADLTGTAGVTQGGTGIATYTTGDTLYASGANTLAKRSIGSTGQVLTVTAGVPTWETPSAGSNLQTFTTPGVTSWNKPSSGSVAFIQVWGGGGSGGSATGTRGGGGGGGGGYMEAYVPLASLGASVSVTVGAGGAGVGTAAGNPGGTSSFGSLVVAYGGGGGGGASVNGGGGGGGGSGGVGANGLSVVAGTGGVGGLDVTGTEAAAGGTGGTTNAGNPGTVAFRPTGGGGGGGSSTGANNGGAGANAANAGGGGGGGSDGATGGVAGTSVNGGGGGGGGSGVGNTRAGGTSKYGGNGGTGRGNGAAGDAGQQPGGGGGGTESGTSGAGGAGMVRVTVW